MLNTGGVTVVDSVGAAPPTAGVLVSFRGMLADFPVALVAIVVEY